MDFKVYQASGVFLAKKKGEYLLQLRDSHVYEGGKWDLFGGFMEPGETFYECAFREIKEELGYSIQPRFFHKIVDYKKRNNTQIHLFFSLIDKSIDELVLNEGADFNFFTPKEISYLDVGENVERYLFLAQKKFNQVI